VLAAPYLSGNSDEESKQIKEGARRVREAIGPKKSDVSVHSAEDRVQIVSHHRSTSNWLTWVLKDWM